VEKLDQILLTVFLCVGLTLLVFALRLITHNEENKEKFKGLVKSLGKVFSVKKGLRKKQIIGDYELDYRSKTGYDYYNPIHENLRRV
jgi:hypothetical protein